MKRVKHFGASFLRFLSSPIGQFAGLMIAIIAFLSLTLTRIASSSIWFDEGYSLMISQHNYGEIYNYTAADVHPPVYYWLLKTWTVFFGQSDIAFRSMSVLFGCITIILLYSLLKKFFAKPTSLGATLLVSISPLLVRYGTEARMYTLIMAICLAATIIFIKLLKHPTKRTYLLYGLLVALGVWTHYFTIIIWLGHWVYRWLYLKNEQPASRSLLRKYFCKEWVLTHVLSIIIFLPWLPIALQQFTGVSKYGFWIPPLTIDSIANLFSIVFLYKPAKEVSSYLTLVSVLLVLITIYLQIRLRSKLDSKERSGLQLINCLAITPAVFLMIISLPPLRSLFHVRYLLPSIIFIYTLFALTLILYIRKQLKPRYLPYLAIIALIIIFAYGDKNVFYYGNNNFDNNASVNKQIRAKEVMQQINRVDKNNTPVVTCDPYRNFEYFIYATANHPVYYNSSVLYEKDNLYSGVLNMMRDDKKFQVIDTDKFLSRYSQVWFAGMSVNQQIDSCLPSDKYHLTKIKTVVEKDAITGNPLYGATLYQVKK